MKEAKIAKVANPRYSDELLYNHCIAVLGELSFRPTRDRTKVAKNLLANFGTKDEPKAQTTV